MPYLGKTPSQATRKRYYKTASAGDTSVSGTMTVGGTLTFTDGEFVDVSVNGVALVAGTDYNTNTANTIAGLSALAANDQVEIVVYDTFSVFSGDVDSNMSVGGNLSVTGTSTFTGAVTADAGVSIDNITIDGTEIDLSSGNLTIDVAGQIILDADTQGSGNGILLKDGGTLYGSFFRSSSDLHIKSEASDEDMLFMGNDGGSEITALTLDMSEAGAATFNAGATFANSCTITTADNNAQLTLTSTDTDANSGPRLDFIRNPGQAGADDDFLSAILHRGYNDASTPELITYAEANVQIIDASDGSEDSRFYLNTMVAGSGRSRINITPTETVFNEDSIDLDFRVEGNGNANALVVHGADDFVGIGLGTPKKRLHIQDTSSDGMIILDRADTSADHQICFAHNYGNSNQSGGNYYAIGVDDSENTLVFAYDSNSQASLSSDAKMILDGANGRLALGTTSASFRFNVVSNQSDYVASFDRNVDIDGNLRNFIKFSRGGTTVGEIQCNNSSTNYATSSDYRMKENVADMTGAIDRVKALAPKRFNFIADADTTVDGFLAHEAQVVVPEAVTGTKDETREITNAVLSSDGRLIGEDITEAKWTAGKLATEEDGKTIPAIYPSDSTWSAKHTEPVMQGIDQAKLVPLLTGALQEAIAEIETLKTKVAALEAEE